VKRVKPTSWRPTPSNQQPLFATKPSENRTVFYCETVLSTAGRQRFPLTEMLFTHNIFLSTVTVNGNCLVWHPLKTAAWNINSVTELKRMCVCVVIRTKQRQIWGSSGGLWPDRRLSSTDRYLCCGARGRSIIRTSLYPARGRWTTSRSRGKYDETVHDTVYATGRSG